jgi:hypothetical protein
MINCVKVLQMFIIINIPPKASTASATGDDSWT